MKHIKLLAVVALLLGALSARAITVEQIQKSGQYYYGLGTADTPDEAAQIAMNELVQSIASNISSDFTQIDDMTDRNGKVDHQSRVMTVVKNYSQTTLTDVEQIIVPGKKDKVTVLKYVPKTTVARMYDARIQKARDMISIADECLAEGKIDMALMRYYWAYSLLRSVQHPEQAKDAEGRALVNTLPVKIEQILSDIKVEISGRDGDYVDLNFTYKDKPVESLDFVYNDGQALADGKAKYGRGSLDMMPNHLVEAYRVIIEYEYRGQARGDAEVESVLNVLPAKAFSRAVHTLDGRRSADMAAKPAPQPAAPTAGKVAGGPSLWADNAPAAAKAKAPAAAVTIAPAAVETKAPAAVETAAVKPEAAPSAPADTVAVAEADAPTPAPAAVRDTDSQLAVVQSVIEALGKRNYTSAGKHFTVDGLDMFNRLTSHGNVRLLEGSDLKYYPGPNGRTVVRGLKMSFAFNSRRTKKTFVEEVSFTINPENKIENVAFGMGKNTETSIFDNPAGWSPEVREIILSFLENYKTAYSLERLDYLKQIFADDAVIIVGSVVKPSTAGKRVADGNQLSVKGQEIINYNRMTKSEYLKHLERSFNKNDFIHLKFADHELQWLTKFTGQTVFAINIRQEYCSTTYADDGYLFLLVDMTDPNSPQIKVRTWQPNVESLDKLYNAGDFFNN